MDYINYIKDFRDLSNSIDSNNESFGLIKTFDFNIFACMAYAKFNDNIIASSNLRDIRQYCKEESITIYTTMDI